MATAVITRRQAISHLLQSLRAPSSVRSYMPAIAVSILGQRLSSLNFGVSLPSFPSIPSILDSIWEGILRAVPKKKPSHSKSRMRRLGGGKDLKDLTSLNKCSACGRTKRMHVLCPHCVQNIKDMLAGRLKVNGSTTDMTASTKASRVTSNAAAETSSKSETAIEAKS